MKRIIKFSVVGGILLGGFVLFAVMGALMVEGSKAPSRPS